MAVQPANASVPRSRREVKVVVFFFIVFSRSRIETAQTISFVEAI
jgi:hypothetical protein